MTPVASDVDSLFNKVVSIMFVVLVGHMKVPSSIVFSEFDEGNIVSNCNPDDVVPNVVVCVETHSFWPMSKYYCKGNNNICV